MELREYLMILRRGWLTVLVVTLLGAALGGAAALLQTPRYEAESLVYVSVEGAADVNELGQGNIYSQEMVRSFVELTTSSAVLGPVIEDLALDTTVEDLAEDVSVASQNETVILEIVASDEDPDQAAAIADSIAENLDASVQEVTPEGGNAIALTTIQPAEPPEAPTVPRPVVYVALGLVVGAALGMAVLALREVLRTRIRTEDDVRGVTEAPILGTIRDDRRVTSGELVAQTDPAGGFAESFRTLRTNLHFLDIGRSAHSFVVTSSVQSEGKTTTAVNLAISLRRAGHRVLLVDADLRRPAVADHLGLEGAVGLTDALTELAQLEDVVQSWGPDELAVLPAGTVPPNPSELLGSAAMQQLISRLESAYDVVLFDTPPLLPVSDAAVLSRMTSGAVLVVGVGTARAPEVRGASDALDLVEARLLGIVMTRVPTKGPDAQGYDRYGGYGYSSVETGGSKG
ncbi:MAG: polysaccharide biosynthesis tyrosine autokinase [Nesterenkonia sp.]|nr:polysaccharide biosynthesis tyrosine autokinase [Nesterenkonia sp.]